MADVQIELPKASNGCPVLAGFDPLSTAIVEDPYPWLVKARAAGRVVYMPDYEMWCVTRFHDVEAVLRDTETYSSAAPSSYLPALPPEVAGELRDGWPMTPNLGLIDPPQHTRIRRLAQKAFTTSQANAHAGAIKELVHQTIDTFIGRKQVDLATEYCQRIPVQVIAPIFSVPLEMCPLLHEWAIQAVQVLGNLRLTREQLVEYGRGQAKFDRYIRALVEERRQSPRDEHDLLTALISATSDDGEPSLTDREIVALVVTGLAAGSETSATTIGHAIHVLLSDRALWEEIVADPGLAPNAVEETLRMLSSNRGIFRWLTRATELGGVPLPAGATVYLQLASAGRDDQVFEAPDTFDLHRENVRQHLGFGRGRHHCLGAPLARVEARAALEALAERIPTLRLVPGHELEHLPSFRVSALLKGLVVEWD